MISVMNTKEDLENQYREIANKLALLVKPTGEAVSSGDRISKVIQRRSKELEIYSVWNQWHDVVEKLNNWKPLQLPRFSLDDNYFNELRKAIISISKSGWYFNYGTIPRDILQAKKLLVEDNELELNDFMCKIITNDYEDLKKRILHKHSHRKNPLTAAFKAHEIEEYYLSIPVFLSQIDGITHDLINKHFFIKPQKMQNWAIKKNEEGISKVMYSALNEVTIFQAESLPHDRNSISRHAILHGGNVSYGTKINGFKVLSLLGYITDLIAFENEAHK